MQKVILRSLVAYPQRAKRFIAATPKAFFSKEGAFMLGLIEGLVSKGSLSLTALSVRAQEAIAKGDLSEKFALEVLGAVPEANFEPLAEELEKAYYLNQQSQTAKMLLEKAKVGEVVNLNTLAQNVQNFNTHSKSLAEHIQNYITNNIEPKIYRSGVDFLDEALEGGFEESQLVLISGEKDCGKTSLGLQIVSYISHFEKVCFYTFEFPVKKQVARLVKNPVLKERLNPANINVIEDGMHIDELCKSMVTEFYTTGARVFLIDSQMMIKSDGLNKEEKESKKFTQLLALANNPEFNFLIFLIVQTPKGEDRDPLGTKIGGHAARVMIHISNPRKTGKETLDELELMARRRVIDFEKNKQTGRKINEVVEFDTYALSFCKLREPRALKQVDFTF